MKHRPGELTNGVNPDDYPPYDVHGVLPWTVLRADTGVWQERKRWWTAHGIDDLAGREHVQIFSHGRSGRHHKISGGKSRFDPFLAELAYTWYSPAGGKVADPFAGGVTRGAVAAHLGRHYTGYDLSPRQVEANRRTAATISHAWTGSAEWHTADSPAGIPLPDGCADYILTCPPYHNTEQYSSDPRDLSVMSWDDHLHALTRVAAECHRILRADRFVTWVVGDLRDPAGHLRGLPEHTLRILTSAGFRPVNHQILITPVGTMYRMLRRWWTSTRSAGRIHQHMYTLVKGDRRRAVDAIREASC